MKKGKIAQWKSEGHWIQKHPEELGLGISLRVKKFDADAVLCDVIFTPWNKKPKDEELEI